MPLWSCLVEADLLESELQQESDCLIGRSKWSSDYHFGVFIEFKIKF